MRKEVENTAKKESVGSIIAYDVTGQVLVDENQDLQSGNTMLQYNTSEWSNGIYFFHVTTCDVTNTVRVVIAK